MGMVMIIPHASSCFIMIHVQIRIESDFKEHI